MLALIGGGAWAALVLYLLARALRQFGAYRAARLSPARLLDAPRAVAVVVPVRNEIANIGPCLAGLSAQSGLSERLTITVVDDGSDDGTTAAAARAADADDRIKVIDAGPLPSGWAGKPHACWRGAAAAAAPWLCFVDADVRAEPGLLAAALTAAAALDADLLSLHPRQELGSFWERVIIPAGLLSLACAKRFDPASADVVNGQVLLVRRDAYFRVGGHAAVRAEICEDKALALRMREAGFSLRVLSAEDFAATRMYRGLRSLWQGFSKNAADALGGIGANFWLRRLRCCCSRRRRCCFRSRAWRLRQATHRRRPSAAVRWRLSAPRSSLPSTAARRGICASLPPMARHAFSAL